jgi:hypothetical protein
VAIVEKYTIGIGNTYNAIFILPDRPVLTGSLVNLDWIVLRKQLLPVRKETT